MFAVGVQNLVHLHVYLFIFGFFSCIGYYRMLSRPPLLYNKSLVDYLPYMYQYWYIHDFEKFSWSIVPLRKCSEVASTVKLKVNSLTH